VHMHNGKRCCDQEDKVGKIQGPQGDGLAGVDDGEASNIFLLLQLTDIIVSMNLNYHLNT
jgi:hypothetical protein